jgi:hypothetical protein
MPEVRAFLIQYWPELIPLAIFLYGFVALLTTTALLAARIVRIALRLRDVRTRGQLIGAFAQSRLEHLLTRILDFAPWDVSGERVVIQSPFRTSWARREVARLYRGQLARVHFYTALAALFVTSTLSWMQDYAAIADLGIPLPVLVPTLAVAIALALFGSLGYMVINAAAKPLVEKISDIPMERVEITWLRLLKSFLERRGSGDIAARANNSLARFEQLIEQLKEAVDGHLRSLHDAVLQLSGAADGFTEMLNAFSENPILSIQNPIFEKVGDINAAIDRLTTELDRLTTVPRSASVPLRPNGADTDAQVLPRLNREVKQQLRNLIKEFE